MKRSVATQRSKGFSMVEVLVALIVLGVGMLGMASLYVTTLRANSSAQSRTQAVNLASDIADRIRANRTAIAAYRTASTAGANHNCTDTAATAATNCSPADMAAHDILQWKQDLARALPGNPNGNITVDNGASPAIYTITISWTEPNSGDLSYSLVVQI